MACDECERLRNELNDERDQHLRAIRREERYKQMYIDACDRNGALQDRIYELYELSFKRGECLLEITAMEMGQQRNNGANECGGDSG